MLQLNRRHLAAGGLALALAGCQKGPAGAISEDDMSLGDPKAKVTVIEYASAACPHCAAFHNDVFPEFRKKYVDTGKVRFVFREFLTDPVQIAAAGALLARCSGKEKYFDVLGAVYHSQQEMFQSGDVRGTLLKIAQSAGINEKQFDACVSDEKALQALQKRVEGYMKNEGVSSTPTFFINGKKFKEGEVTLAELGAAVDAAAK